jgi:hypothetical protein
VAIVEDLLPNPDVGSHCEAREYKLRSLPLIEDLSGPRNTSFDRPITILNN